MDNTMLIQIANPKALRLINELEELQLIKVLRENQLPVKTKLSKKYKDVFSPEDAKSFDKQTKTIRGEWNNI